MSNSINKPSAPASTLPTKHHEQDVKSAGLIGAPDTTEDSKPTWLMLQSQANGLPSAPASWAKLSPQEISHLTHQIVETVLQNLHLEQAKRIRLLMDIMMKFFKARLARRLSRQTLDQMSEDIDGTLNDSPAVEQLVNNIMPLK